MSGPRLLECRAARPVARFEDNVTPSRLHRKLTHGGYRLLPLPVCMASCTVSDLRRPVAVEVVSPSNPRLDFQVKRDLYLREKVGEYWVVNPDALNVSRWRGHDDPGDVISKRVDWLPQGHADAVRSSARRVLYQRAFLTRAPRADDRWSYFAAVRIACARASRRSASSPCRVARSSLA